MTERSVDFFGGSDTGQGLPSPFHRYLITASDFPPLGNNRFIAVITALTVSSPMPEQQEFLSHAGMDQAIALAIKALKALPQLKGITDREQ